MYIQNFVTFYKNCSQNIEQIPNYEGGTELRKDRQTKSNIAPTFLKWCYKEAI